MLERYESVSLRFPGGFIGDNDGFIEFAKDGEDGAELVGGGFPAEAADEELALGGVGIGDRADGVE